MRNLGLQANLEKDCVALANENEIFDILNMKFIEPHDRKVCCARINIYSCRSIYMPMRSFISRCG